MLIKFKVVVNLEMIRIKKEAKHMNEYGFIFVSISCKLQNNGNKVFL